MSPTDPSTGRPPESRSRPFPRRSALRPLIPTLRDGAARRVRRFGPPWSDPAPARAELFGIERLEQHAESLARAQEVTATPLRVPLLRRRLDANAATLLSAYRASVAEVEQGRPVVPAAEWLLDNYHLVEAQIREIHDDLPPRYYRQLPKLAGGPFAGYPRVLGLVWAFVAHTDSLFEPDSLRRFIAAYQRVQPLTIGELWAVAITLRVVLVENLRRLADQMTAGRATRAEADALADALLRTGEASTALLADIAARPAGPLAEGFAAQLARRLRDQDPRTTPALDWLDERLAQQGSSVEEAVQRTQDRQGASNVTVRNVITSMRLVSDTDWTELVEAMSLVDARLSEARVFAQMDFPSRTLYRGAVEVLARGSGLAELEVADRALALAAAEPEGRRSDLGWHLIGGGRGAFEAAIGFRAPPGLRVTRLAVRMGILGYVGAISAVALATVALAAALVAGAGAGVGWAALWALALLLPASEAATALVDRLVTRHLGAVVLPGLELKGGVPPELRTLVAVPTLLTGEADLREQVERLEVHFLSGRLGDVTFALLTDGLDADRETVESDAPLLALAAAEVAALNARHGPGPAGPRFLHLHRRRRLNAAEGTWMGWERKRGKLHELNRLLRGAADTSFGGAAVPEGVRYVITLDADTRLPREAALRLVGKAAHPLNRPILDPGSGRVVEGYGILQPRVTPALPLAPEGSRFQRLVSGPAGMDPYASAVSDVYQDLLGEGSYTGKGLYDVDAFEAALAGRVPENALLSHDLFEGAFARAGYVSDVELVETFPSRYDVAAGRTHRWTRGDWQLLPWILGRGAAGGGVTRVGRLKMADNLRRSLLAPATLAALAVGWLLPAPAALSATAVLLALLAVPPALPVLLSLLPRRARVPLRGHLRRLGQDLRLGAAQLGFDLVLLPDRAWRMGDAILRSLARVLWTRRRLLEWTTALQAARAPPLDLPASARAMAGGLALGWVPALGAALVSPGAAPLAVAFALLWTAAPGLALWVSRPTPRARAERLAEADARRLRLIGRQTWRYFEATVTEEEGWLPPDNLQETPTLALAHRTSPTNMGLYLLSAVAARDFGWAGTLETAARLEATLATMEALPKHRGHLLNWYGTRDRRVLEPAYVSSVDSGNLAGHLIALAVACEEWAAEPIPDAWPGMGDAVRLARRALPDLPAAAGAEMGRILVEMESLLDGGRAFEVQAPALLRLVEKAVRVAGPFEGLEVGHWARRIRRDLAEHAADRALDAAGRAALAVRLRDLGARSRRMALAMDFAFLLDPDRRLLSIGYSVATGVLDANCYDLLASEARLASFVAIAKGDAPTRHWFRLGRTATPVGPGAALVSWSGSMFEYLMPLLVMREPEGSLLAESNRRVVQRQRAYASAAGVPWGISESAFNARDVELTYQYSTFGVPGLGLKRGLVDDLVIAPYATALAAMVDPVAALQNLDRLEAMGARGRFGLYEALDFTPSRRPEGEPFALVRSVMAHHQGMTVVALANVLLDGRMTARFHREPMIQAAELLLQERSPRDAIAAHPRAEEAGAGPSAGDDPEAVRIYAGVPAGPPVTHLMSNGRYSVMLTASGGGYSRWGDLAVTRWREDPTRDDWGSWVGLRDVATGAAWSATPGPWAAGPAPDHQEAQFREDRAEFIRLDGSLTTTLDVLVSAEDDGEVRRVSIANNGRRAREIDVTSYVELALAPPASDLAHPAFSKLFVQTSHLPEYEAVLATRRPRGPEEAPVWAAHFAVVEADALRAAEHETDRARFVGRGRAVAGAAGFHEPGPLSGTVGTVLDPVFALRRRIRIAPGQSARIAFWTVVAPTREAVVDLVDRHHDRSAFDRARTLAWTRGQVQRRHVGLDAQAAADFQRLAAPLLYADPRFRPAEAALRRGAGPQSGLWALGISGDLPLVLLRIDDLDGVAQVRELLQAHEYWRLKRLAVDLVILNEHPSSYVQDLAGAIDTAVRSSQARSQFGQPLAQGGVHVVRADLATPAQRDLLVASARVVLLARRGPLADQLARLPPAPESPPRPAAPPPPMRSPAGPAGASGLEFFNGLGGFDRDGTEYVTILEGGATTPAPWINVVANEAFGFQASAEGSGFTWAANSRENQLTPWSNDPVADPAGEALYVRDEETGELWTPTALPIRDGGRYEARHGFGYSRFSHEAGGVAMDLLQHVHPTLPVKISRLTLRNLSGRPRRLAVTAYAEWVLGPSRSASAAFVATEADPETRALLAANPWSTAFPGRVAFADLGGRQTDWTCDRTEVLGRGGSLAEPAGLLGGRRLSGASGAGPDPCAALRRVVTLDPGASVEVVATLGQAEGRDEALALVRLARGLDLDATLAEVRAQWSGLLGSVQVRTPDRAMDILLNGWLLYQATACRVQARAAFYQASGAYGFRDQLQDGMALTFARPEATRAHLLRAAARQFPEGDVQHWWLPHSGQGVRTRISDDRVWLAYATATYVTAAGDAAVLDESVPFLEGPELAPGEHDAFFQPLASDLSASLFEHCARGLDQAFALRGPQGLPLMGTGDWNDGMNRVGEGGTGESVWLGWLLLRTVALFAPLAEARDPARAAAWRAGAEALRAAMEAVAWDGAWYRRATFDDGTWLGSAASGECRIDSIAQSWAVLSGAADPGRAAQAMASLDRELIRREDGLALLFAPPFDRTERDPGYIKGYPPGLRENGGQYSHAAMWAILAFAELGQGDRAAELFALLNPVNHALTPEAVHRYKVEPYAVAADVYSVAPHAGRGGWTWYTGSAAWMHRAGIEGILGIRREGATLVVRPRLPAAWPGYSARIALGEARLDIEVARLGGATAWDGEPIGSERGEVRVPLAAGRHHLRVRLEG